MSNRRVNFGDKSGSSRPIRGRARSLALRLVTAISLVGVLSACQTVTEPARQAEPVASEPTPIASTLPSPPEISLASAIDLLQRGREGEALRVLEALDSGGSGSASTASRLRRQIKEPVEELIPGPYEIRTVRAGETLSEIAQRVLGDPLMFYALARLNAIPEPRLVGAGESIRVPAHVEAAPAATEAAAAPAQEAASRSQDIDTVAGYLARSGRPDEAWQMLVLEVESGAVSPSLENSLTELTLARAEDLQRRAGFDEALESLSRVLAALRPEHPGRALLTRKLDAVRKASWLAQARRARESGDLVEAFRLAQKAENAATGAGAASLIGELREALLDQLHNEALVAWRDRDVDRAIRHWETLLEAVPDFEPARVYLDRARQLRERLERP